MKAEILSQFPEEFSRTPVAWSDFIDVKGERASVDQILEAFAPHLAEERKQKLQSVVDQRSLQVATVLENIYDVGNVSAVMRSVEAFGFLRVHLVQPPGSKFKAANRVTKGTEKWLDTRVFSSNLDAIDDLKSKGYSVWATDLNTNHEIETLDWSKPIAFVLGNEKDGVSQDMLKRVDGTFRIPMRGFAQSFNISVAGALILYHARREIEKLESKALLSKEAKRQLLANYYLRCFDNPQNILRVKKITAE